MAVRLAGEAPFLALVHARRVRGQGQRGPAAAPELQGAALSARVEGEPSTLLRAKGLWEPGWLSCRRPGHYSILEEYVDADAAETHNGNVGALLVELFSVAELVSVSFYGELNKYLRDWEHRRHGSRVAGEGRGRWWARRAFRHVLDGEGGLPRWPQHRSQARRLLGQLKVTENAPDDGALRQVCQHPSRASAPWARAREDVRRMSGAHVTGP